MLGKVNGGPISPFQASFQSLEGLNDFGQHVQFLPRAVNFIHPKLYGWIESRGLAGEGKPSPLPPFLYDAWEAVQLALGTESALKARALSGRYPMSMLTSSSGKMPIRSLVGNPKVREVRSIRSRFLRSKNHQPSPPLFVLREEGKLLSLSGKIKGRVDNV